MQFYSKKAGIAAKESASAHAFDLTESFTDMQGDVI